VQTRNIALGQQTPVDAFLGVS